MRSITEVFAGRWQIPCALVAASTVTTLLYKLIPEPVPVDFQATLLIVTDLERAGDRQRAAAALRELLTLQPPLPADQQGVLHERLAELIYTAERSVHRHSAENAQRILEHDTAARAAGLPETLGTAIRRAFALAWSGQTDASEQRFRELIGSGLPPAEQRGVLRELARMVNRRPWAPEERRELLTQVLHQPLATPACLWWGLQQAVQDALDSKDIEHARALLNEQQERLGSSSLQGYREYLNALVLLEEGRSEEALAGVEWVEEWLRRSGGTLAEMDEFGKLASLNRWLRGRAQLAQGLAGEALESFAAVQHERPLPSLRIAATVGRSEALAALGRHAEAQQALGQLIAETGPALVEDSTAAHRLTESLIDLFDARRAGDDVENGAAYLALCWHTRHLAFAAGREDARPAAPGAPGVLPPSFCWTTVRRAARAVLDDDDRRSWLLWEAARHFARGGGSPGTPGGQGAAAADWAAARAALRMLLDTHIGDPHRPEAMLLLGQAYRECGQPHEAVDCFTQLVSSYPELEPASRARLERARILMELGAQEASAAERQLVELLTGAGAGGAISPDAAVYRDALFTLCTLLESQGRYAEAIGRWQDFLELYPEDPQTLRVRLSIADAYRRSAVALRDHAAPSTAGGEALAESRARFRRAAELFAALEADLRHAARSGQRDALQDLLIRLGLFYRAECLLEQVDPLMRRESLAAYRLAAAEYDGQPAALAAQVRIADLLLQEDDVAGAARALERARWLLKSLPADSFLPGGKPPRTPGQAGDERADWERYLTLLLSVPLFREAYTLAES